MKSIIKIFVLSAFVLFFTASDLMAQKFGHVNSIELLSTLDEWKSAEKQLETYAAQIQKRLKSQEEALLNEYNKILDMKEKGILSPADEQKKANEIQQKQINLENENAKAVQDVQKKEIELTNPIRDRVMKAIKDVAREGGYIYIFDLSMGGVLYADETEDLTAKVKAKL